MASNNKPRTSLLNLFDPLANSPRTPSTPQRHAPEQDKENYDATNNNNITMTVFFNKTCKSALHTQPKPLKRRLIDIGDLTLEDAASPEALLDEALDSAFGSSGFDTLDEDENMTLTFQDMMKAATPNKPSGLTSKSYTTPRRSFADFEHTISLPRFTEEHSLMMETPEENLADEGLDEDPQEDKNEPTPSNREISRVVSPELPQSELEPHNVPLPLSPVLNTFEHTSLDWIIDAPDKAGSSFGEIPPNFGLDDPDSITTTPTAGHFNVVTQPKDPLATSVNIPESNEPLLFDTNVSITISESSSVLPSIPELTSTDDSSPHATLRPIMPNTSSKDPCRASVDLQSSFHMLLQSEDMSFDLMRDKDSFLMHAQSGMDSLLYNIEDDPSFDLEAEKMKMVEALKEYTKDSEEIGQPNTDDAPSPISSSPTSPSTSVDASNGPSTPISCHTLGRQGLNLNTIRKRLSAPISISSPRLIDHPLPSASPNVSLVDQESLKASSPASATSPVFVAPPTIDRRRSSLPLSTPKNPREKAGSAAPLPAVPALKVIKRTRTNVLGRQESITSISGSSESASAGTSSTSSCALEPRGLPTIVPLKTRRVKDPEPQTTTLASQPTRQLMRPVRPLVKPRLSTTTSNSTSTSTAATTTRPMQARADGPRRFPISESTQAKPLRAATISASSSSSGPRRPIISASAATMLPAAQPRSTSGPSGLRAPSQSSSMTNGVSSLPKPVPRASTMTSRLPAPKSTKTAGLPTLRRVT